MGKFTIITTIVIAGLFVSAVHLAPGGGGGAQLVDDIQPGTSFSKGGVIVRNHADSQGPIAATPFPISPGGQPGWKKIEIESGEKATIIIKTSAPAADLLKLRIFVKGTGRLRLLGDTGPVAKPLGQVSTEDLSKSTGIVVSGLGAEAVEGDPSNQIIVLRRHVVLRTTTTSSGTVIGISARNVTALLCDSGDIVNVSAAPFTVMQY